MRLICLFLLAAFVHTGVVAQSTGLTKSLPLRADSRFMREVMSLWKAEKYAAADNYYAENVKAGPSYFSVRDFAERKIDIGDVNGADKVYALAIQSNRVPLIDLRYMYMDKATNNFKRGNPVTGLEDVVAWLDALGKDAKNNMLESTLEDAMKTAYYLGDVKSLKRFQDFATTYGMKRTVFLSSVYLKVMTGAIDEAIGDLKKTMNDGAGFMFSKEWAKAMLPLAYVAKGDYAAAREAVKTASSGLLSSEKYFSNELGAIALAENKFNEAVNWYTIALQPVRFIGSTNEKVNKFAAYTNRAKAYEGLKDLVKAKKDYEAALVYNPDYAPAAEGLARLEGRMLTDRQTDKSGPAIELTEPSPSRGLKVTTTATEVMIKGIAADPSGIQSVTIGGVPAYTRAEGDFWASVPVKAGMNKIAVVATDMAGNGVTREFEVDVTVPQSPTANDIVAVKETPSRNVAILIASQNYDDPQIPSLENPVADAVRLKLVLKNGYGFNADDIVCLFNPRRADFSKAFLQLSESIQPEDNLLIFYAGHGIWKESEKKGYWLLADAQRNDPSTWLPNKDVLDQIASLSARHTLLITDACFSGSVFRTRGLGADAPATLRDMDQKISRVAITSGNDSEVPDQSVFMKYLVKALSDNREKYMTAQKMFVNDIIEAVMSETKTEPRYGTLESAGHVGGDFIFSKR